MLEYCAQDVTVSVQVAKMFEPKLEQYADCIETEHRIATIMAWQEREGFPFDVQAAHQLESKLRTELDALSDQMRSTFLLWTVAPSPPRRNNGPRATSLMRRCANSRSSTRPADITSHGPSNSSRLEA